MSCRQHERGASALEYVGMIIVAAIIVTALVAAVVPERLAAAVSRAICLVTGQTNCPAGGDSTKQDAAKTPLQKATWGQAWFGGDSFASGEGVGDYQSGTDRTGFNVLNPLTWGNGTVVPNTLGGLPLFIPDTYKDMCHRSNSSYQAQVFTTLQGQGYFSGQAYSSAACSGSTVPNLYDDNKQGNAEGPQAQTTAEPVGGTRPYDKIPSDASLISLSLGGNDIGFADILMNCLTGVLGSGCGQDAPALAKMAKYYGVDGEPGELEIELQKIKAQHPDARIILMGYPSLFSEKPPATVTFPIGQINLPTNGSGLTVEQLQWANRMTGEINASSKAMCERLGIEFVDPTSQFVGPGYDHRIGSAEPWINPLSFGSAGGNFTLDPASFHPNRQGHDTEAGLLLQVINEGTR